MNVFNPEDIKIGDMVKLKSDIEEYGEEKAEAMEVQYVCGKNGNKIYCEKIGLEFYASCFKKVS